MNRPRLFLKRLFTPVTILMVPHSRTKSVSIRVPVLAIASSVFLFLLGASLVVAMAVRAVEHQRMKERLSYLSSQFLAMKDTMQSLRQSEKDFRKLFGVKSKTTVLESADLTDSGSLDMEVLREQIEASMRSVTDIRKYIGSRRTSTSPPRPGGRCPAPFPPPTEIVAIRCTERSGFTPGWTSPCHPAAK